MAWSIRSIYYYLVCFATLMTSIFGSVQLVRQGLDLAFPSTAHRPSPVEMHQRYARPDMEEAPYTREELEEMAEEESRRQEQDQRYRTIRNLLGNLALLLIAFPVYLYHWRQVRQME